MAPPPRMPKQLIDDKKSTLWAISFLSSVAVGYKAASGAVFVFDLVNMETFRAHRMDWTGIGKKSGKLPFGGAFRDTGYAEFRTSRPANFSDFDDKWADLKVKDRLVHSKRTMTFYDGKRELAEVSISGWGPSAPGGIKGKGKTEIHFSNGKPVGLPQFRPKLDLKSKEELQMEWQWRAKDSAYAITLPSRFLFAFDSAVVSDTAEKTLDQVIALINSKNVNKDFSRISVQGHTDGRERVPGYNMDLSRRRAQAVMKYLKDNIDGIERYKLETEGYGAAEPVAKETMLWGMDNPLAREKNRRVEIIMAK